MHHQSNESNNQPSHRHDSASTAHNNNNNNTNNPSVSLRTRLSHFTWTWFEVTMSTGAMAVLLGQQPYTFRGLFTIGKCFFILDLVLFVTFCALVTTRFVMHPPALKRSLHHPHESFFFGTFWVSIALILYATQQYGVPAVGPWLPRALRVSFWLYAALAFLVAVFQYHIIFDKEEMPVKDAMPAWIFPAYPFLVLGPLASVLLDSQPGQAGVDILIGGIVFQGLGWMIAFFMYTIYFTRLVNRDLPEEAKRPGMYVAVGPCAYTANAFIALGSKAPTTLPSTFLNLNTTDSISTGAIWKALSLPCALFLWLTGLWFFAMATVSVLGGIRRIHFTLNFWAFIFPNAGLTVAALQIGTAMDSTGIKAVGSAMTVLLVVAWLGVAAATVRAVWAGKVLWPGRDEDEEDIEGRENEDEAENVKEA